MKFPPSFPLSRVGLALAFLAAVCRPAAAVEPRVGRPIRPAAGAAAGEAVPAAGKPAAGGPAVAFLRLTRDGKNRPQSLDTAIVRYRERPDAATRAGRAAPLEVDLVGAVHLGGRGYYAELDRRFKDYDAVLYELVAAADARVPRPGRRRASGAIGSAQQGMTRLLGLEFQLEQIDYTAKNFVHADLSPREFDAAMARRGESWWTMFAKLMRESVARADRGEAGGGPAVGFGDVFGILFGADREIRLRRIMAEQFTDMEVLTAAFGGEEGSSLITDRNAAAIAVLRRQIARGRRRLAIFYGAAHMDDFDRRLREDFRLQPRETVWLEAWDLRNPAERN
ncbi:MAG: hypothetical protein EBZ59_09675 [Planctomycetia bacterium]|nr:hypothetical protein [Planctomycetia bacterium]